MSKLNLLITGSSSGFGELTARHLAEKGHRVFATMRGVNGKNEDKAKELREWASGNGHSLDVVELDVTDQASVDAAVKTVVDAAGQIDVVVNNAGIGGAGVMETYTTEDHQRLFDVNYYGVIRVNRAVLPAMRERNSGLLIHVTSVIGRIAIPFGGPYCPSKFALEAYAESLRMELASLGVDSVIVEPGAYPTDFITGLLTPSDEDRIASYGELAKAPEQMFEGMMKHLQGDNAPDPNQIAVAISDLIDTPADKRPLRTVVDQLGGSIGDDLNAAVAKQQQLFMGVFGE
jgi:NAD(P)-dependent dehydrogenase (short-subunit alcohol dehydrogenase family)